MPRPQDRQSKISLGRDRCFAAIKSVRRRDERAAVGRKGETLPERIGPITLTFAHESPTKSSTR